MASGQERSHTRGGVGAGPSEKRKRQKRRLPRYLNPDEAKALREAINTGSITGLRNRCMFELMYRAGLRVSEVCHLEPRDVNIAEGELRILDGKGGDRTAYFDKTVVGPLLESWKRERKRLGLAGSGTFFCTIKDTNTHTGGFKEKGQRVAPRSLQSWLKVIARRAGVNPVKVTPHVLRHTWATEYYTESRDIIQVKNQLGHKNLETTMVYTHVVDGDRKAAIQARKDPLAG